MSCPNNGQKPAALIVLAAGIGSRFGKNEIKQLALLGPSDECMMEYSIYDALSVGFTKVVFIIRRDMEAVFRRQVGEKISRLAQVEYVYQDMTNLPAGFSVPNGRTKPWGTGHAVLCCKEVLHEPFLIINADDYYGRDTFQKAYAWLNGQDDAKKQKHLSLCSIGFVLGNTLSAHGSVTRGICQVDETGHLTGVEETRNIIQTTDGAAAEQPDGSWRKLDVNGTVSMNVWGACPDLIPVLEHGFLEFLQAGGAQSQTEEYLLPVYMDHLIQQKQASVQVLPTCSQWFGITYQADKELARVQLAALVQNGTYPTPLWN